jgi:hypothetical protein
MPHISDLAEVRQDQLLTSIALSFKVENRIADLVAPPIPVLQEDGQYAVYGKESFNIPDAQRRPKKRYKEIDWTLTKESYHAEEYGLEMRIDDRERRASPSNVNLDTITVETITENLLNSREKRVADMVRSTANVTQNVTLAGVDRWDDAAGGDPIGDIDTGQSVIQASYGYKANAVVMGWDVWQALRRNPVIRAELVDGEQLTESRLAQLFGVERIIVGSSLYNSANLNQAATMTDMWGTDVILAYINPRGADGRPSFAYQLRVDDMATFRWRDVPVNCDVFRVREIQSEKLVAETLGYLIKTAVS